MVSQNQSGCHHSQLRALKREAPQIQSLWAASQCHLSGPWTVAQIWKLPRPVGTPPHRTGPTTPTPCGSTSPSHTLFLISSSFLKGVPTPIPFCHHLCLFNFCGGWLTLCHRIQRAGFFIQSKEGELCGPFPGFFPLGELGRRRAGQIAIFDFIRPRLKPMIQTGSHPQAGHLGCALCPRHSTGSSFCNEFSNRPPSLRIYVPTRYSQHCTIRRNRPLPFRSVDTHCQASLRPHRLGTTGT